MDENRKEESLKKWNKIKYWKIDWVYTNRQISYLSDQNDDIECENWYKKFKNGHLCSGMFSRNIYIFNYFGCFYLIHLLSTVPSFFLFPNSNLGIIVLSLWNSKKKSYGTNTILDFLQISWLVHSRGVIKLKTLNCLIYFTDVSNYPTISLRYTDSLRRNYQGWMLI